MDTELAKIESKTAPPVEIEQVGEPPELERRFFNLRTLLSFGVAAVIIYLFIQRMDLDLGAVWVRIQSANVGLFLFAFFVYYLTFPLRSIRWRSLLINVGMHTDPTVRVPSMRGLIEIIMLSWFANCVVPAKLGDGYRAYLLKKAAQAGFSRTLGTILAERLMDISVMVVLLLGSAFYLFNGHEAMANRDVADNIMVIGVVMLAIIATGLLTMRFFGSHFHLILPKRLHNIYEQLHHGTLGSFRQLPSLVVITLFIWFGEAARLFLVTHALNVQVSFPLVLFVSLTNSLLTALPVTPGGLGLVEAGMVGVLTMADVSKGDAASIAMLDRVITYWSIVVFGLVLYLWRKRR